MVKAPDRPQCNKVITAEQRMMNFIYNYTIICIAADVVACGVSLNKRYDQRKWQLLIKGFLHFSLFTGRGKLYIPCLFTFLLNSP